MTPDAHHRQHHRDAAIWRDHRSVQLLHAVDRLGGDQKHNFSWTPLLYHRGQNAPDYVRPARKCIQPAFPADKRHEDGTQQTSIPQEIDDAEQTEFHRCPPDEEVDIVHTDPRLIRDDRYNRKCQPAEHSYAEKRIIGEREHETHSENPRKSAQVVRHSIHENGHKTARPLEFLCRHGGKGDGALTVGFRGMRKRRPPTGRRQQEGRRKVFRKLRAYAPNGAQRLGAHCIVGPSQMSMGRRLPPRPVATGGEQGA
ncbi:Uncharacterised protein [Kocuria rosea]|nr:Uncharacterised protein [Kocuria rosea]